jgi:hypothetical protein
MFSRREAEGYLEIDHRDSPGFTPEQAKAARFGTTMPVGSKRFQFATKKCSNCDTQVIINPLRTRERFYCQKCDDYHCDRCALITKITGVCKTMKQVIDEFVNETAKL